MVVILRQWFAVTSDMADILVYWIGIGGGRYDIYTWYEGLNLIGVVLQDVAEISASQRDISSNERYLAESPGYRRDLTGKMRRRRMKNKWKLEGNGVDGCNWRSEVEDRPIFNAVAQMMPLFAPFRDQGRRETETERDWV